MMCVTLDLWDCHNWLWYDDNYIFVNGEHVISVEYAIKAGAITEDELEDVLTLWQVAADSAWDYRGNYHVEYDSRSYVIYIYCGNSEGDMIAQDFSFLPEDAVSVDFLPENGYEPFDDEEYYLNWKHS